VHYQLEQDSEQHTSAVAVQVQLRAFLAAEKRRTKIACLRKKNLQSYRQVV
jgi:hypothetical protein